MRKKQVRMGVRAGITRNFNISNKLRLEDKATIFLEGKKLTLKVDEWISQSPAHLYRAVHTGEVSLTRDSHFKLKQAIISSHPELIEWSEKSKNKILFARSVKNTLKSQK